MAEETQQVTRGGMCSNPFGGEDRIDRINLLEFLESNIPSDKVLYSCIIQDAASNYLYAFLGKNGTSAEEFFAAWQYFFKVESTNKSSWDHNRTIKHSYISRGQKVTETHQLTDDELKLMCFDKQYELSGLHKHMHIDKFRLLLRTKRQRIVKDNLAQITSYVNSLYQNEINQITNGQQIPLQVWNENILTVLTDPPTPMHLASLIYVSNKLKTNKKPKSKKKHKGSRSNSTHIVEGQQFFTIETKND